ncbi:MAG: ATP-binding cassette domain-containing protein, partial [Pseudomonadota bacterium]|nr:ATP-binding cassette domain-containing protein [Pseudomonadota bacterium]
MTALLTIDNLSVAFGRYQRQQVVHQVSFQVNAGEKFALVGESGSGKSVTALSILQLHERQQVAFPSGSIDFEGQELLQMPEKQLRQIRGKAIAMIFQEPMTSLNPVYPIGQQLIEPLMVHEQMSKAAARHRMLELLERTGIPEPQRRFQ